MKIMLLLAFVFLFFACKKSPDSRLCTTYLVIDSTNTPRSSTVAVGISSIISCYGSDLCYSYTGMEVAANGGNVFKINAKGAIPCVAQVCAQALYRVRDTIQINTTSAGIYYLQFYNNTSLVKTDTIIVN
ncbi:MAG: hypothetical protein JNM19_09095 [Chitinophagaceae bacterium]|nr:hypothetical protein [Chitinophagaceae bacterium]